MELHEILKQAGPSKRSRRVGRGRGGGRGKTCGRGHKGAGSRSGSKSIATREGGQMPLFRRLPKRGFSNFAFRVRFNVVNVGDIEARFDAGAHVTPEALLEAGLVRNLRHRVKVLGNGDVSKKFKIEASKFSKTAQEKISKAGGEIVLAAV